MAKRVFFSFHYDEDNWRAAQVRNMGVIEGNPPVADNDWETVKRGGDVAIERWIQGQLSGSSCTVVLVDSQTAGRKWINYEITESWKLRKGILGIHIHNLQDRIARQSYKGLNPFNNFNINGTPFSSIINLYEPPYNDSTSVYNYIRQNIANWVDQAISIRSRY